MTVIELIEALEIHKNKGRGDSDVVFNDGFFGLVDINNAFCVCRKNIRDYIELTEEE